MSMKEGFIKALLLLCFLSSPLVAARKESKKPVLPVTDSDKDNVILEIEKVSAPYEKDNYVVFTEKQNARYIGIAFDFERFSIVHSFNVRTMTDEDGEVRDSLMYYVLERPKNIDTFSYRLVIDGLWTLDPMNSDRYYDEEKELMLSRFTFASPLPDATRAIVRTSTQYEGERGVGVHFVLRDKAGQKVRLSGSFTNWDPWIYEMKESAPGFYEISLPLPQGTYYYTYYIGMESFIDRANGRRAYTEDGRAVSVITVK